MVMDLHKLFTRLLWRIPTHIDNFVVLIHVANWHRHIIIRRYNLFSYRQLTFFPKVRDSDLLKVVTEASL